MDITSANSQFFLTVPGVFPAPVQIQGYAVDDAFTLEAYEVSETRMGVDAILSGGFVPSEKKLNVVLQPDSPSVSLFDIWNGAMVGAKGIFVATATIALPSIGKAYLFNKGFLKTTTPLPGAKKVLEPQTFTIGWQDISVIPL